MYRFWIASKRLQVEELLGDTEELGEMIEVATFVIVISVAVTARRTKPMTWKEDCSDWFEDLSKEKE